MEYGCKQKKPAKVGRFDVKWITYECCNILMKSQIQVWLPLEIFIKPKSYIRECIKNLVAKFISTDAIRGWNQPGPYIYNFGAGQRKWCIYVYNFGAGQENNQCMCMLCTLVNGASGNVRVQQHNHRHLDIQGPTVIHFWCNWDTNITSSLHHTPWG